MGLVTKKQLERSVGERDAALEKLDNLKPGMEKLAQDDHSDARVEVSTAMGPMINRKCWFAAQEKSRSWVGRSLRYYSRKRSRFLRYSVKRPAESFMSIRL